VWLAHILKRLFIQARTIGIDAGTEIHQVTTMNLLKLKINALKAAVQLHIASNIHVWLTDVDRYQIRLRSPNETQLAQCNFEGDRETLSGTSELIPHF